MEAWLQIVTPHVFSTLGIPVRRGRDFSPTDRAAGAQVVVINEATARQYFPGENPIGQRLTLGWGVDSAGPNTTVTCGGEIVGIVGDTKRSNLARPADPVVYVPFDQCSINAVAFVARTTSDPAALLASTRDIAARIDPDVPLFNVGTVAESVRASLARPQLDAWVVDAFAALALLLALIGIYGVLSYSVRERRHELGVRVALGARGADIARLVVGDGLRLAFIGLALGLAAAVSGGHVLAGLLYGVTSTDLATYGGVALVLLIVAALAAWLPARRAAAVDPMIAIRGE